MSLRGLNQRSGRMVSRVTTSGNPVTITDRGSPVAQIVPLTQEETPVQRLLRDGKTRPVADVPTGTRWSTLGP